MLLLWMVTQNINLTIQIKNLFRTILLNALLQNIGIGAGYHDRTKVLVFFATFFIRRPNQIRMEAISHINLNFVGVVE